MQQNEVFITLCQVCRYGFVHTSKRHVSSFFMADIASDKIIAESLSPFAKVNSMFHTI